MDLFIFREIIYNNSKIFILTAICIFIDFLLGISKAYVNKTFSSSKLKDGIVKILTYILFIFLFTSIQWAFPFSLSWEIAGREFGISTISALIIIMIEISSIAENSKEIPLLTKLILFFKDKINGILPDDVTGNEEKDDIDDILG